MLVPVARERGTSEKILDVESVSSRNGGRAGELNERSTQAKESEQNQNSSERERAESE